MYAQDRQNLEIRLSRRWRLIGVIIVTLFFALAVRTTPLLAAPALSGLEQETPATGGDDGEFEAHGILDSRPPDKEGDWVIDGKTYKANGDTQLEDEHAALEPGACVYVKARAGDPPLALKIKAFPDHECEGHGDDDIIEDHGILSSRPPDGENGTWVIDGKNYESNEDTEYDDANGPLAVDACVFVRAQAGDPALALKIKSLPAHECEGHGGEEEFISHVGKIESRPTDGNVGEWVIGGKPFTVTESTIFDGHDDDDHDGDDKVLQHDGNDGNFEVGDCVEVKALESDSTTAVRIESKDKSRCGDDGPDDERIKRYGRIERIPAERIGEWIIEGVAYTVTEQTELDPDHGKLDEGTCVKVVVLKSDPTVALLIESEDDYKCTGREDDDDELARGKLYGIINELPDNLRDGDWVISNMTFVVSPTTQLITNGGTFTEGAFVKVEFVTDKNDVNYARKIELKNRRDDNCRKDDDHDDGNRLNTDDDGRHHRYGRCPGSEGKTYGLIDFRPTDELSGTWGIGGVEYIADDQTDFYPTDDYQVGERVLVQFVVNRDGSLKATSIKESLDDGGLSDPTHSKFVGFVTSKPPAFVGEWEINEVPFVADLDTIFLERAGIFAVDAYVVVEYAITNDQRLITEIRTHVPPGAGDTDQIGTLESMNAQVAVAAQPNQSTQVWTIGGVNYTVTEATQVIASNGGLVEGDEVFVNSYSADGQQIATLIRQANGKAFLPQAHNE